MKTISKLRLVLAGVLLGSATMLASPTDPVEIKTTYHCHHKAQYYAIKADLEDGKITIEQAQRRWQKALKELNKKEEAK